MVMVMMTLLLLYYNVPAAAADDDDDDAKMVKLIEKYSNHREIPVNDDVVVSFFPDASVAVLVSACFSLFFVVSLSVVVVAVLVQKIPVSCRYSCFWYKY